MGDLLIRNVPEALKREIAERADRNGTSLSDEAKNLLQQSILVDKPSPETSGLAFYEAIRSAFESAGALDDEFSAVMDEVEAERKVGYWRPVEGFE